MNYDQMLTAMNSEPVDITINRHYYRKLLEQKAALLEALQWAVNQIEDDLDPDHQEALKAAHAAIAKALGSPEQK